MNSLSTPPPLPYDIGLTGLSWILISAVVILVIDFVFSKKYPNSKVGIALGCFCAFGTMIFGVMWTILVDNTLSGFAYAISISAICSIILGCIGFIIWAVLEGYLQSQKSP